MKLRAEAVDMAVVTQLYRIVTLFAKQSRNLVLKFTRDHIYIISETDMMDRAMRLWTEIPRSTLFAHYELVGIPPDDCAYLRTRAENLMNALKCSMSSCNSLKVKLKKMTNPCLLLEFETHGQLGTRTRPLQHYIDVEIVYKRHWSRFDEPTLPPADLTAILPPVVHLKSFMEKCKNMVSNVNIKLTSNGEMILLVIGESLEIVRKFSDIIIEDDQTRLADEARVSVDVKRLSNFLKAVHLSNNTQIYCNLTEERFAHFSFLQDGITVQFVLPHLIS